MLLEVFHIILIQEWTLATFNNDVQVSNLWVDNIVDGKELAKRVAKNMGSTYNSQVMWAKQPELMDNIHKVICDEDEEEKEGISLKKREAEMTETKGLDDKYKRIFSFNKLPSFKDLSKKLHLGKTEKQQVLSTRPAPHSDINTYEGPTLNIGLLSKKISRYADRFKDLLWRKQWYLQDYRTEDGPVMDHNVVKVYNMGYTGNGVTVGVIDTPIQVDHPDLKENIDIWKSHDMCSDLPLTKLKHKLKPTSHGTGCAGVIGMVAGNKLCGVGIAYKAKIAAINHACAENRPNSEKAKSLVQNLKYIDIYSNSWGPPDDPKIVYVMNDLIKKAYKKGSIEGRNGKGVIYVHSSGNGGTHGDHCATDHTINQPYVIGITSANQFGKRSNYAEQCTAIFATTYSGSKPYGFIIEKKTEGTVTLNPRGKCTVDFTGTSASCPLAAGLIALVLEANPNLTYRDVMHIIARSAEVAPLADNDGSWYMNGEGFWMSNEFGFGLMNGENMILLAKYWTNVPRKHSCTISFNLETPEVLSENQSVNVPIKTDGCQKTRGREVYYLEHIEVASIVEYPGNRGDMKLSITSPAKTKSVLLLPRFKDADKDGLEGWSIMSTHNWGENPEGIWTIHVEVMDLNRSKGITGLVKSFAITFHGLPERPAHLEKKREYAAFRLPDERNERGTLFL